MSHGGSTADHSMQASTALRETTNVAPVAKRGTSRVTVKAAAPATDVAKSKAKGKTVNRALQTTGKQASRPSRYAVFAVMLTLIDNVLHTGLASNSTCKGAQQALCMSIFMAASKHDQNVQQLFKVEYMKVIMCR